MSTPFLSLRVEARSQRRNHASSASGPTVILCGMIDRHTFFAPSWFPRNSKNLERDRDQAVERRRVGVFVAVVAL